MTPERRALLIEALAAIHEELAYEPVPTNEEMRAILAKLSDAEIAVKVANIEALIERAQQTDV